MSFKYRDSIVTLANYDIIFEEKSVDVLDEIRSAVLDDTPLGGYIDGVRDDGYKLGQIRMALREYLPVEFINPRLPGECIYKIRKLYKSGYNLELLRPYIGVDRKTTITGNRVSDILDLAIDGVDITSVDFTLVKNNIFKIFCRGLKEGYPMWLLQGTSYTQNIVHLLLKAMRLNIDIQPFISVRWSYEQIFTLVRLGSKRNLSELFKYINSKFSAEQLEEVGRMYKDGFDLSLICTKDKEGYPVYDEYQMSVLHRGYIEGVDVNKYADPDLTDMGMSDILHDLLANKGANKPKVLGGTIR